MHWNKLKPTHYFTEPVEHIYSLDIFDSLEYDKLYENQNNLDHHTWQDFDKKYRIGFEFYDDLRQIDKRREIICLWFFRERNDRNNGQHITLAGKDISYSPNAFLITKSNDILIKEGTKRQYIRRPCIQLDMSSGQYDEIVQNFKN